MNKHYKCLLWKGLWGLGALALILSWLAGEGGHMIGMSTEHLLWDALVLAVLSIPIKLDCHSCGVCGTGS